MNSLHDVFEKTEARYDKRYDSSALKWWDQLGSTVLKVEAALGTCACIVFILVLLKFKKLRTKLNMYLLHFNTCYLGIYAISPIVNWSVAVFTFDFSTRTNAKLTCTINKLEASLALSAHCILFLILVEWTVIMFKKNTELNQKYQKYVMLAIYLLNGVIWCLSWVSCIGVNLDIIPKSLLKWVLGFIGTATFIADIANITRTIDKNRLKFRYSLIVLNSVTLSWFPFYLLFVCTVGVERKTSFLINLNATAHYFVGLFNKSGPIIVVLCLKEVDKEFEVACNFVLKRYIRCCGRKSRRDETNLGIKEETVIQESQ